MLATHGSGPNCGVVHIKVAQAPDGPTRHRTAGPHVVERRRLDRVRVAVDAVAVGHCVLPRGIDPVVVAVDTRQVAQHVNTLE